MKIKDAIITAVVLLLPAIAIIIYTVKLNRDWYNEGRNMNITIHDTAKPKTIKYKLAKISNDKFQLYFSSFADRDFIIANVKYLWGAPTKDVKDYSINFMGEVWKVKYLKLYHLCGNEVKNENVISFERVEQLFYEDPEEPRLSYMLGILEEVYHIEKA